MDESSAYSNLERDLRAVTNVTTTQVTLKENEIIEATETQPAKSEKLIEVQTQDYKENIANDVEKNQTIFVESNTKGISVTTAEAILVRKLFFICPIRNLY